MPLPNMQTIRLRPTDNLAAVLACEKKSRTLLTEFFKESGTEGCPKILYGEFSEHYRWDTGSRTWIKRKNEIIVIGRLFFVAPAEGERFFLRLLLLHIRGPTSFESLQTVNGYKCATLQEAALRHRLLENEDAAELCMAEACTGQMSAALRCLFKIHIYCDVSLACDVPKQSSLAALIIAIRLIIWDDASMEKGQNVESLDLLLRDLCVLDKLFGGNGTLQSKESEYISLPDGMVRDPEYGSPDHICKLATLMFPELDLDTFDSEIFTTREILTPLNDDVDARNSVLIEKFPSQAVTYKSHDSMLDDNCKVYPVEFINKLNPGGMRPHELILKEKCSVILLRNLRPSFSLCNGTRMICKRFLHDSIKCVIMVGHHNGEHVFIPRIKLRPATTANYPFQFQRNQFPLKLSFAMTVNKFQGQTLSQVVVYLPRPCFSHGQLYNALSRAHKASQVTVIATPGPEGVPSTFVKNVVSYDVLSLAGTA
ncbi:ATP-dependent DNA helicase pfh1-like [Silene latifolia]|uniref:ATP-dependent DNA helicase pfh1-like n=1 Tax=Silene latifolia TaxID=37657 RepID=UPI003D773C99